MTHLLGDVGKVAQLPVSNFSSDSNACQKGHYIGDHH